MGNNTMKIATKKAPQASQYSKISKSRALNSSVSLYARKNDSFQESSPKSGKGIKTNGGK